MKRTIAIAVGLLVFGPAGCLNSTVSTSSQEDAINDDPEVLQIEDLVLHVSSVNTSHAWCYDQKAGKSLPVDENVNWSIDVRITNSSKRLYTFTGWSFGENSPIARDNSGQRYESLLFKSGVKVVSGNGVGVHENLAIPPNSTSWISIPFERPRDNAKTMTIELPAGAFGLKGSFRVKVSVTDGSRKFTELRAVTFAPK